MGKTAWFLSRIPTENSSSTYDNVPNKLLNEKRSQLINWCFLVEKCLEMVIMKFPVVLYPLWISIWFSSSWTRTLRCNVKMIKFPFESIYYDTLLLWSYHLSFHLKQTCRGTTNETNTRSQLSILCILFSFWLNNVVFVGVIADLKIETNQV